MTDMYEELAAEAEAEETAKKARYAAYQRAARARRIAAGMCSTCGKHKPVEGKLTCAACLERGYNNALKLKGKREAAGVCVTCGKAKPYRGAKSCLQCLMINTARSTKSIDKLKLEHKCVECRAQLPEGWKYVKCAKCNAAVNENNRRLRIERAEKGLCIRCGGKRDNDNFKMCSSCRAYWKEAKKKYDYKAYQRADRGAEAAVQGFNAGDSRQEIKEAADR